MAANSFLVHRCRFVDIAPNGILSIRYSPETCSLDGTDTFAVGKGDGSIEIWKTTPSGAQNKAKPHSFLWRRLPGVPSLAPKDICWSHQTQLSPTALDGMEMSLEDPAPLEMRLKQKLPRLFSCSLNGMLCEWNLQRLCFPRVVECPGGGAWSIDVSPNQLELAVSCEDGIVRVFDIADERLEYKRSMAPNTHRCLSVKYSPCGRYLYGGFSNSVVIKFSANSGQALVRVHLDAIRVERGGKGNSKGTRKQQTAVWALDVLPSSGKVVTGDSLGSVQVWDMETGSQVSAIQHAHKADVLAIAVDPSGRKFWTTGADRAITEFNLTSAQNGWVLSGYKRYHSHDVLALAHNSRSERSSCLLSGGVDASLIAAFPTSVFLTKQLQVLRKQPIPHFPLLQPVSKSKSVVVKNAQHLDVYGLGGYVGISFVTKKDGGSAFSPSADDLNGVDISEQYQFVARLKGKAVSNYVSFAANADCSIIAVSDLSSTKLYSIRQEEQEGGVPTLVERIDCSIELSAASHLQFSEDSTCLYAALIGDEPCKLVKYDLGQLPKVHVSCVATPCQPDSVAKDECKEVGHATSMVLSPDEQLLALVFNEPRVFVYSTRDLSLKSWSSLLFNSPVSSVQFAVDNKLAVFTVLGSFYMLKVDEPLCPPDAITKTWAERVPKSLLNELQASSCLGMSFASDGAGEGRLMCLWTVQGSWLVQLGKLDPNFSSKAKDTVVKRKRRVEKAERENNGKAFHSLKSYKPLLYGGFLNNSELLMFEVSVLDQLEKLPASLQSRKFFA